MSSLLKKGNVDFPMRLVANDGYSSLPNRRTDKGTYIDGDGELNRKILPHKRSTITLTLMDMSQNDKEFVQSFFPNRDLIELTYWNDEECIMKTGKFYVPDIMYAIKSYKRGVKTYKGFTVEFIEY